MHRRTTLMLTGITILGLTVVTLPQVAFAQSAVLPEGIFQLNLAKSKYNPGPAPKSGTAYFQVLGQNRKATLVGIAADGNPTVVVFQESAEDGKPYLVTGTPAYDTNAITRVDAHTINFSRTKAGRVVQTGNTVISADGKTYTVTTTGTDANGRQISNIAVYDKQ